MGVTFFAGTFVRHPLVLAAARSVLLHLKSAGRSCSSVSRSAPRHSRRNSMSCSPASARYADRDLLSWLYFNIHNEHPLTLLFYHPLRGIHIRTASLHLTTAHSERTSAIYEAFRDSVTSSTPRDPRTPPGERPSRAPLRERGAARRRPSTHRESTGNLARGTDGDEASCAFNESVSPRRGALNPAALQEALTQLFARHDALRICFSPSGEEMRVSEPEAMAL